MTCVEVASSFYYQQFSCTAIWHLYITDPHTDPTTLSYIFNWKKQPAIKEIEECLSASGTCIVSIPTGGVTGYLTQADWPDARSYYPTSDWREKINGGDPAYYGLGITVNCSDPSWSEQQHEIFSQQFNCNDHALIRPAEVASAQHVVSLLKGAEQLIYPCDDSAETEDYCGVTTPIAPTPAPTPDEPFDFEGSAGDWSTLVATGAAVLVAILDVVFTPSRVTK